MKPSVDDQLAGTCRILETVVAPHVAEPFARTILDNLIANLRMLTVAAPKVATFLREDNQATLALLRELHNGLSSELAADITDFGRLPSPDAADICALETRNQALRNLLARVVTRPDLPDTIRQTVEDHMADRASRMPMRYVPTAAPSPPDKSR